MGVALIILLKGPGCIIQMGGAVKCRDDLNMILLCNVQNLNQVCSGQVFPLIRGILIGRKGPGSVITATKPGKIVGRIELTPVICRIPDIDSES